MQTHTLALPACFNRESRMHEPIVPRTIPKEEMQRSSASWSVVAEPGPYSLPRPPWVPSRDMRLPISRRLEVPKRVLQFVILLVASWSAMTFTHESGHLIGGWLCGGTLKAADVLPWHLPYSIFDPDPHPLITLWSGPILGVVVPFVIALIMRRNWMWFLAHFCMLANGAYLATAWASGDKYLDTPKLLEHGAHPATIAIYCLLTICFGYRGFRRHCIRVLSSSSSHEAAAASEDGVNA